MLVADTAFNNIQDAIEKHMEQLVREGIGTGIFTGFDPEIDGDVLTLSLGSAWDPQGRSLHRGTSLTLDLTTITRPPAGQVKWVSFCIEFARYALKPPNYDILSTFGPKFSNWRYSVALIGARALAPNELFITDL